MKMYHQGKGGDSFDPSMDQAATAAMLKMTEEDDLTQEDKELLKWTAALDFQSYQQDWLSLSTSQWSEASCPVPGQYFDQFSELPEIPIDGYSVASIGDYHR